MQKHINYFDVPYRNTNKQEDLSKFFIPGLALSYGTARKNLVDKYKDYPFKIINYSDNKEGLLRLVQAHYFILADLALYLDIHNDDQEALNLYNNYTRALKEVMEKYEAIYGSLLLLNHESDNWNWVNSWPWERRKN